MNDVLIAFLLALFAGMSTGIGSAACVLSKSTPPRFMAFTLGFSAGVMMYVSLKEIAIKAVAALCSDMGERMGNIVAAISFFSGILLIALIGKLIPSFEESSEHNVFREGSRSGLGLLRTGIFSAFALALHNFPEGMATFVSALRDPGVAIPIVAAIAIHNIPEGIAVAAPVYRATASRKIAFLVSFFSGLTEPVGALVCWLVLMPLMSDTLYGILFALAAGIMVYICVDEILPSAQKEGHHDLMIFGFVFGMAVMAVSLLLFI